MQEVSLTTIIALAPILLATGAGSDVAKPMALPAVAAILESVPEMVVGVGTIVTPRDLAAAQFRHEHYGFARSLYVVGGAQALHFQQMIQVLRLLGRDWAEQVEHVPFGMMRFKDRKMATRKGDIIVQLGHVHSWKAAKGENDMLFIMIGGDRYA